MADAIGQVRIEPVCGRDVGDPPDSCRCLLPRGHSELHACRHVLAEQQKQERAMCEPDIVIEPSQWSVFCADCVAGTFTKSMDDAEAWEAEHRAWNHTDGSAT